MPKVQINDAEIFYEVKGKGEKVIAFLNGLTMSTDSWILQTAYFAKYYRVLLHDFHGQGKSSLYPTQFSFEEHAKDLKMLLDILQIDKIHLVGVSYGAVVGIYFALMYPERVHTLILGTTVCENEPHLHAMIESWILAAQIQQGELLFKIMAPLVYSNIFYETKKEWLDHRATVFAKVTTLEWYKSFIGLCTNFFSLDVKNRLEKIKMPTLIVAAQNDLLTPVTYSAKMHALISNSHFVIIENAGHALFFEKPEEFNVAIKQFIDGQN